MKILAIETSTTNCSVGLLKGDVIFLERDITSKKHSDIIIPMITKVLAEASLNLKDLGAVAFGAGPGSFTGLRIACAVAQGIGYVNNIPVVPISSMKSLALAMMHSKVFVSLDAHLKQIYCAAYEFKNSCCSEVLAPKLYSLDEIPSLTGEGWVGCGNGFDLYQKEISKSMGNSIEQVRLGCYPNAKEVLLAAKDELSRGGEFNATDASPLYVREKVAKQIHEQLHCQPRSPL